MILCLRTAGCPSAERNVLTEPTGGASPVLAPGGVDSLLAQLRQPGRAVPLKRRRKARDQILGREVTLHSLLPARDGGRTIDTCLVRPARGVDARFLNQSLAAVSRASSTMCSKKTGLFSPVRGAPC